VRQAISCRSTNAPVCSVHPPCAARNGCGRWATRNIVPKTYRTH